MINVIIPVWVNDDQTLQLTVDALDSIRKGCDDGQVILIDNGSTFGQGKLRELADLYVRNKENLGYAKAVNQGLKLSGDIVAVANNDIRVSNNWWKVASTLLREPIYQVGSVHFRMIPYDQPFNPGDKYWYENKERWCSSSFFVMRNKQLYDENFLNSLDDLDYWRRFRESGWKTAYTNRCEYQHLDSHTQQKIVNRSENDIKNQEYYKEKWGETSDEWLLRMYPEQMREEWKPFP